MINYSALPIYSDLSKQNHRKGDSQSFIYKHLAHNKRIIPFQFTLPTSAATVDLVSLKNINGDVIQNMSGHLATAGLTKRQYPDYGVDVLSYPALIDLGYTLPLGQFYLQLVVGGLSYYSEVFTVKDDMSDVLTLTYWNADPLIGDYLYADFLGGYKSIIYLCSELHRPEYPFEEEVEERDGNIYTLKQISKKVYKFTFYAPEYLLDVLRFCRMADYIQITDKGVTYDVRSFLFTPRWKKGGHYADVEAEAHTDLIVKRLAPTYISDQDNSFNNDFNNDYN